MEISLLFCSYISNHKPGKYELSKISNFEYILGAALYSHKCARAFEFMAEPFEGLTTLSK